MASRADEPVFAVAVDPLPGGETFATLTRRCSRGVDPAEDGLV